MMKNRNIARIRTACAFVGLILLSASSLGWTACNPFQPPPEFYVGNTSTDGACTHSNIQSAIADATCASGTNIYITNENQYTSMHLTVAGKNVALIGRDAAAKCGAVSPPICDGVCTGPTGPLVSISASDAQGHATSGSTISVSGNSTVTLRYLDIRGGTTTGDGGGVHFDGTGALALDNTWIRGGHANNGGAIAFNGQNASTLTIGPNVLITGNQVDASGGGVAASGNATVNVLGPEAVIEQNLAPNGYGGGIYVLGAATANIASANAATPVLFQNQAAYGGGLALIGVSGVYSVTAQLFSNNALRPVEVSSNHASHTGGAIYLKPYLSIANHSYATLCASDFRFYDNVAANGGAIYSDTATATLGDLGGNVYLNTCVLGLTDRASLGGVTCTNTIQCNTIESNVATDADAAVILMQDVSLLEGRRFTFTHNQGDYGIRAIDDGNGMTLSNCLFADNDITHELLYLNGSYALSIDDCTFAHNLIGATHVIHDAHDISLQASLFYEPGTLALDYTGSIENIYVNYVVSNDITTFPHSDAVIAATAQFVDLPHGDYHLAPTSPGVDFSYGHNDFPSFPTNDRDGKPRDIDLPSVPNVSGPRDVGAFERQNLFRNCGRSDSLFCDGFEF